MNKNNFMALLKYEILSMLKSFFAPFFGLVFPLAMGFVLAKTIPNTVPEEFKAMVTTNLILTVATIIPMSLTLVSFPSLYAQELEQKIIYRLELFGISTQKLLLTKIIAYLLLMSVSLLIYGLFMTLTNDVLTPTIMSIIIFILCLYALAIIYFIFAFAVSNIFKKFGITYAITMVLYFISMFFSGMIGAQPESLPSGLRAISKFFPASFINTDFANHWETGFVGYNFAPLIQAFIANFALAGILFIISLYINCRRVK